ncbi:MAG: phosphatase PAP2 family protein [Acidobacteria bacterium]|nr:phosphatase PAP2 family protein [Acidobacteriota bacterium]
MGEEVPQQGPEKAEATQASPQRRRETRRLHRAEFAYAVGLAAFAVLAVLAKANAYFSWDLSVANAVQSIQLPGMLKFMEVVSLAGNGATSWVLVGVAVLAFFLTRRRSEAFGIIVSAAGGSALNRVIKHVVARPRPTLEHVRVSGEWAYESFPSGHVTFYVCFFGFLFFVAYALLPRGSNLRRAACALAALPVLLIGLSRVYLGAHWPSDTLGAYLFSGLWLAFSLDLYRRWKRRATFHTEEEVKEEVGSDE